jgi:predicted phage terminase large subunit-like protein
MSDQHRADVELARLPEVEPQVDVEPASKNTPEKKEYNRVKQIESRQRKADKRAVESLKYTSKVEVSKPEALELLSQRIQNEHVREVCYDLALNCAEATGVFPNRFFFAHGYQKLIESQQAKTEKFLEMDPTTVISSEIIFAGDAYAIWDYSISSREPDVTFTDFINTRKILKSDWYELGLFIGMPLEPTHREWSQFLPGFTPTLHPDYSFGEMREWLLAQKSPMYSPEMRDFLLMAPRGSMKSSVGSVFLATAILCCPSLRLLLVSETTAMTLKFLKAFKALWEIGVDPAFARFQYWFAEFCITQGDGNVRAFTSPMRSIAVREETAEILSMEQSAQGRRFDLGWIDDPIGKTNTANVEQRQKTLETYGAILKLRESGGAGIVITIGTPWIFPPPGEIGDLYYELKERNKQGEPWLAVRVDSAWTLKSTAAHLFPANLNTLNEQDHVEALAFPQRLPFKILVKEAKLNIDEFRSQFLCEYVESELNKWTPTFVETELYQRVKPINFFDGKPVIRIVASLDAANSESITADRSSICIAKLIQYESKNVAFILDVIAGQWRYSALAEKLVEAFGKYGVQHAVVEKNNIPWQDFQAAVQRNSVLRGVILPQIQWRVSTGSGTSGVSAKVKRIKGAEVLFENGQLYFAYSASWNEMLFHELTRFKGQRSGSSLKSKDDNADSLGLLCSEYLIKDTGDQQSTPEQMEMEAMVEGQRLLKLQHDFYFGVPVSPQQQMQQAYTPDDHDSGPLYEQLGKFGLSRNAA